MAVSQAARLSTALFFVAVFAYVVSGALVGFGRTFPRAALFPLAIGIPSLLLALFALAYEVRQLRSADRPLESDALALELAGPPLEPSVVRRRTAEMIGWVVAFFLTIWLLGFLVAVPAATFLYLKLGAREPWRGTLVMTALSYAFFWGLFDYALHVPFPEGVLVEWLKGVLLL